MRDGAFFLSDNGSAQIAQARNCSDMKFALLQWLEGGSDLEMAACRGKRIKSEAFPTPLLLLQQNSTATSTLTQDSPIRYCLSFNLPTFTPLFPITLRPSRHLQSSSPRTLRSRFHQRTRSVLRYPSIPSHDLQLPIGCAGRRTCHLCRSGPRSGRDQRP